jgi:penicillin-binding protein activator
MNKRFTFILIIASVFICFSCASTKVERVDVNTIVDLNGYWNDTDVRIVCESLIDDCISSPRINAFEATKGRVPYVIVDRIRNESDEHMDTEIVSNKIALAIINSGKMEFVSSKNQRESLRQEKLDQADYASENSAKSIGNETAADFMLMGSVKTIVQTSGNKSVRTYYVSIELQDIETNRIVWMGENSSIKKVITKSKSKL